MRPSFLLPAVLAIAAAATICVHSTTALADPLPVPEVCTDVPMGHPSGRVRYFCDCAEGAASHCVPGNDAAKGDRTAPRRSYEAARRTFESLQAGDTIAFCRGGSFLKASQNRWVNSRCQAENRCVVRDYAPPWATGDEGAPIVRSPAGGRAFSLDDKGRSSQEEGYAFMNLDLRSEGGDRGFFVYNDVDIWNVSIDRYKIGVHVAGSNKKHDVGGIGRSSCVLAQRPSMGVMSLRPSGSKPNALSS